jgi:hypothetical protein
MRTVVFSDVHGEPSIIAAVVEHSNYQPGVDRLIFAGDAIGIGRDSLGCLQLLGELGAECLVGNHEFMAAIGDPLECHGLAADDVARLREGIQSGRWRLATQADGLLITHAGLGITYLKRYQRAGSLSALIHALNAELETALAQGASATNELAYDSGGPLWWRPGWSIPPLPDVVQVVGHTPPELPARWSPGVDWSQRGIHLIDPYVRDWVRRGFRPPVPLRYAVIEGGAVSVIHA